MSWQIAAHIREMFVDFVASDDLGVYLYRTINRKDQLLTGLIEALSLLPKDFKAESADLFIASDLEKVSLREKWGTPTALLTTEGFENLLEIGTQQRENLFGLQPLKQSSLVPRDLAFGVTERTLADGSIEVELDEKEIEFVISKLELSETKSVAVCFLHSKINPTHEVQVAEKLSEKDYQVTLSHSFEGNELERAELASKAAFLQSTQTQFFEDIVKLGFIKEKIHVRESIPNVKSPDVHITFLEDRIWLEKSDETKKLFTELSLSTLSRIYRDNGGLVHVGPEKIDGEPGPVCFGKGLNLSLFDLFAYDRKITCEGIPRCRIDITRATRLLAPLAKQLRMTPEDCADQFIDLACSSLAQEITQVLKKEKIDKTIVRFTFGGWLEPLLAPRLAKILGISQWQSTPMSQWSSAVRLFEKPLPEAIEVRQGTLQLTLSGEGR
jgi:N-methylhydantoinase A